MTGNKNWENRKILITGVTGFLGSHIAEILCKNGYKVIALKRSTSNLWRCVNIQSDILWVDADDWENAEKNIIEENPSILIHCAWSGVKATDRDNWSVQTGNLLFLSKLFELIKKTNISKTIALGSQAEYGQFEGAVDEKKTCRPDSAYGASKIAAMELLRSFAEKQNLEWYWLRIFSVFGPREENNWLIPATIQALMQGNEMNLTPCEQRYDYLYAEDFAKGVLSVVEHKCNQSGVYNMSSGTSMPLKTILLHIQSYLTNNHEKLNFGFYPYRPNQVMHMEGNSTKFFRTFNFKPESSVFERLDETIEYYKSLKSEKN